MNIQLIKGRFSKDDALELLSQLVLTKIKFHEGKIQKSHSEEDIKMRERRIKQLQHDFHETKVAIMKRNGSCELDAEIKIN
jgi:hypothetical protein